MAPQRPHRFEALECVKTNPQVGQGSGSSPNHQGTVDFQMPDPQTVVQPIRETNRVAEPQTH